MDTRSFAATSLGFVAALALWLAVLNQAPSFGGFGILARDSSVVVSDADVVSYSASGHEMALTAECAARLEKGRYLEGPFSIVVDGDVAFTGTFVPPVISRSYPSSEVVITYPSFDLDYGVMKIQMGYPWAMPGTPDVDDSALVKHFAAAGRLAP